jgi:hypothetical protein
MTITYEMINRIDGHILLSDIEIFTDGTDVLFDQRMIINSSKFKKLGLRKIKCMIADNLSYPCWIHITYYNRINVGSYLNIKIIYINLTNDKSTDIGTKIIYYRNSYLESKGKDHRFGTSTRYDGAIFIIWYNINISDVFLNKFLIIFIQSDISRLKEEQLLLLYSSLG